MFNVLRRYTAPFVLLFALTLLTGAATAADSLAGNSKADLCCQGEAEAPEPRSETECSDTSCRCLSCSVPILFHITLNQPSPGKIHPGWLWGWHITSAPGRAIEYPPEHT